MTRTTKNRIIIAGCILFTMSFLFPPVNYYKKIRTISGVTEIQLDSRGFHFLFTQPKKKVTSDRLSLAEIEKQYKQAQQNGAAFGKLSFEGFAKTMNGFGGKDYSLGFDPYILYEVDDSKWFVIMAVIGGTTLLFSKLYKPNHKSPELSESQHGNT